MSTFESLGLEQSVLLALGEMGFENPTPIQEQSIPVFLESERDILALAQTGTGKTAAFGLPLVQLLDFSQNHLQALVLCPTRELCLQISRDLQAYSKHKTGVKIAAVYGGSSIDKQIGELRRGAQIVVATPGRLMDLMSRKALQMGKISHVVLDEADEMLNMGFEEDVEFILGHTPETKRVCLFSATMPKEIRNIANQYMHDPAELSVGKKNSGNENITHQYAVVQVRDKYAALKRFIDFTSDSFYGIIFCTTKNETQEISDKLIKDGYNSDCLHGDLSQSQREKVMGRFRNKTIKVLLATDVAARGIDVTGLTHVVHYHLPDDIENYTHRSGRTARAGKTGISFTLLNVREAGRLREIEKLTNIHFEQIQIPSAQAVLDKRIVAFTQTIKNAEIAENIAPLMQNEEVKELLTLTPEELVLRILSLEFKRFSIDYINSPDLNSNDKIKSIRDGAPSGRSSSGNRLFVNLGKKDGFGIHEFKDWVAAVADISFKDIHVDIKGVYSFVEVGEGVVDKVLQSLNAQNFNGRAVRAEVSGPNPGYGGGGGRERSGGRSERSGDGGRGRRERSSGGGFGESSSFGGRSRSTGSSSGGGDRKPWGGKRNR